MQVTYLDNAATTPLDPDVRAAMFPWLEERFGNPSSRHPLGVAARAAVETAREAVAEATGAAPQGVVFTSGGTEADNLGVLGLARAQRKRGRHVLIGPTEHPAVRDPGQALVAEGFEVESPRLAPGGGLDVEDLFAKLRPDTVLVAQMLVNNEFGSIYDVSRIAALVRANAPQALLHVDGVQGIGKLPLSLGELGAHSLALSGHKIHGPQGTGALVLADGVRPRPLVFGGDQERGIRSGTENVAGIVGLGCAVCLAVEHRVQAAATMRELRVLLGQGLREIPGAELLDPPDCDLSPAIAAVVLPGPPAEVWLHHLETHGVMTSVGSACQAQKAGISPALLALGLDERRAKQVLRLSFSRFSVRADVEAALDALAAVEKSLGASAG